MNQSRCPLTPRGFEAITLAQITTESALRDWRHGSTQAERLCAALLHIDGYQDVDPQHPLGGPDALKDVICRRNDVLWTAAVFFPSTVQTFAKVKRKFTSDVAAVSRSPKRVSSLQHREHLFAMRRRHEPDAEEPKHERLTGLLEAGHRERDGARVASVLEEERCVALERGSVL